MNYNDFFDLCKRRRSIRKYKTTLVESEIIDKILLSGIQAPSGTNTQGWRFRIITEKGEIIKIANIVEKKINNLSNEYQDGFLKESILSYGKNFFFFKNAPVIILLYAKKPNVLMKRFCDSAEKAYRYSGIYLSLGMVMQNMMLAAKSLGLGTCPLTGPLIAEGEINDIFSIPDKYILSAVMSLGYEGGGTKERPRKPLDKFIL